jgi:FixJ family two-component response regulator
MPAQPESICVVDDDASVRNSIERLLDSDGLKAQSFEDAEAFFAHAGSHAVPLAVLDVWMAETSGLQVQARPFDNGNTDRLHGVRHHAHVRTVEISHCGVSISNRLNAELGVLD